jgi:hypothetical protein
MTRGAFFLLATLCAGLLAVSSGCGDDGGGGDTDTDSDTDSEASSTTASRGPTNK